MFNVCENGTLSFNGRLTILGVIFMVAISQFHSGMQLVVFLYLGCLKLVVS
jgi:hypothetical protein